MVGGQAKGQGDKEVGGREGAKEEMEVKASEDEDCECA